MREYVCMFVCVYVYAFVCLWIGLNSCARDSACVCVCLCPVGSVCAFVCGCVYVRVPIAWV